MTTVPEGWGPYAELASILGAVDSMTLEKRLGPSAGIVMRDLLGRSLSTLGGEIRQMIELHAAALAPVPMLLCCPICGARHLDVGVFATKPHHTHACQSCGMVWRPAVVNTVGVQFLPGYKNGATTP